MIVINDDGNVMCEADVVFVANDCIHANTYEHGQIKITQMATFNCDEDATVALNKAMDAMLRGNCNVLDLRGLYTEC